MRKFEKKASIEHTEAEQHIEDSAQTSTANSETNQNSSRTIDQFSSTELDDNSILRKSIKTEQAKRKYRSKEEQSKNFVCTHNDCQRDYATKQALKVHLRKEHDIQDYTHCSKEICGLKYDFPSKSLMNKGVNETNNNHEIFTKRKPKEGSESNILSKETDWKTFLLENGNRSISNNFDGELNVNFQGGDDDVIENLNRVLYDNKWFRKGGCDGCEEQDEFLGKRDST